MSTLVRRNSFSLVWSGNLWQPPGGPETGLFVLGADTCRLRNLMHLIHVNSAPRAKTYMFSRIRE